MTLKISAVAVCVPGLARLGQQPRILHRDHRLRGEILQQCDLFVGKRPHLLTIHGECAKQGLFATKRDGEESAPSGNYCVPRPSRVRTGKLSVVQGVEDMNIWFASDDQRPCEAPRCGKSRPRGRCMEPTRIAPSTQQIQRHSWS